jgi:hypothetical protein
VSKISRQLSARSAAQTPESCEQQAATCLDRIARLLALVAVKGEEQVEKVRTLSAVGFSASEVAQLLQVRANTVSAMLYRDRKARARAQRGRKEA